MSSPRSVLVKTVAASASTSPLICPITSKLPLKPAACRSLAVWAGVCVRPEISRKSSHPPLAVYSPAAALIFFSASSSPSPLRFRKAPASEEYGSTLAWKTSPISFSESSSKLDVSSSQVQFTGSPV